MVESLAKKPSSLRSEPEQQWLDFLNMCDENEEAEEANNSNTGTEEIEQYDASGDSSGLRRVTKPALDDPGAGQISQAPGMTTQPPLSHTNTSAIGGNGAVTEAAFGSSTGSTEIFQPTTSITSQEVGSATVKAPVCALAIPKGDHVIKVTCRAQKTSPQSTVRFVSPQTTEWVIDKDCSVEYCGMPNPDAIYLRIEPFEDLHNEISCRQTTPGLDVPKFCNVTLHETGDLGKCGAEMPTTENKEYPIMTSSKAVYKLSDHHRELIQVKCTTAKTSPQPTIEFLGASSKINTVFETKDGKEVYIKMSFFPHPSLNFDVITCVQTLPGSEPKFNSLKLCVNGSLSEANDNDRIRVSEISNDKVIADDDAEGSTDPMTAAAAMTIIGATGVVSSLALAYKIYHKPKYRKLIDAV